MSTFVNSVTCVTKVAGRYGVPGPPGVDRSMIDEGCRRLPDRDPDDAGSVAGFMLPLGWRSTSLMLFLAPGASGPEVITEIIGGEPVCSAPGSQQRAENIRVRDFIAAAKVERAASAGRIASGGACLICAGIHRIRCIPLQKIIIQKRPLRSVHETVHK